MPNKLITAATLTPVSLAECKAQCRVDGAEEDALINTYLLSAVAHAEHVCNAAFMPQRWLLTLDGFPPARPVPQGAYTATVPLGNITLPKSPLIAVESVVYDDPQGIEQVLASAAYRAEQYGPVGRLYPAPDASWPSTRKGNSSVRITYTAGYAGAAGTPQLDALRAWLLLRVGSLYQNRESLVDGRLAAMPFVDHLLDPYCTWQM